jgi:hypothetical protein
MTSRGFELGRPMKLSGRFHSETRVREAIQECERRRRGLGAALLELVASGISETPAVRAACSGLHPLEVEGATSLLARQILIDLVELVLPNILRAKSIVGVLSERLSYEILELGTSAFLRWRIDQPDHYLTGSVDQYALARDELPERVRLYDDEVGRRRDVKKYYDEQFSIAGLPPVEGPADLTPDHVLLLGALLSVAGYHLIPGQAIPPLIRGIYRRQWKVLGSQLSKKFCNKYVAHQKTKYGMRGYGLALTPLVAQARREAGPLVRAQRRQEAEERRQAREANEAEKLLRREQAEARRREAAAAAAAEVAMRDAAQRESLRRKSQRDRERWEQALSARKAAAEAIDRRNKELLQASKRDAKKRKAERAREREERSRSAELDRRAALDAHLKALPPDLVDDRAETAIELLKRDARSLEASPSERALVAAWDHRLHSGDWVLRVDPDILGLVETWLRNEFSSDDWLQHLEVRRTEENKHGVELRILEARRAEEQRKTTEEQAAAFEAAGVPGTRWSEQLRFLEMHTTEERIERLKGCGFVGPSGGFATLERHLQGETTDRERRDYGRERWQAIGSAFAELRALERLAFYRVTVRFTRELPGVLNPDFLIIDTLGALASQARIRPMDVKKVGLDLPENGRTIEENAAHYFEQKLLKAARQLEEGMRRYGNFRSNRRADGFRDGLGGTALFVFQSRARELIGSSSLDALCERLGRSLTELDSSRSIESVDCVLAVLDYVDGARYQRPIMGLHRDTKSTSGGPGVPPGWTERHAYIDYLTSEHNVERVIGAERL